MFCEVLLLLWHLLFCTHSHVIFCVYCVISCRMELSYFSCIVLIALIAVAVILSSPTEAYKSSSFHHMYTVPGQFNHSYELNVSHTAPISIFYNQSHHQVIVLFLVMLRYGYSDFRSISIRFAEQCFDAVGWAAGRASGL